MTAARACVLAAMMILGCVLAPAASAATNPLLSGFVSNSTNLSGATSVAISGNYAYTTAYHAGDLTAIDISNPAAPVVAGQSAVSNALLNASTVNIVGGFAYVVSKNRNGANGSGSNDDGTGNSLTILNVSTNPAQPMIVGTLTDSTKLFGAYGVAVSGNYAYVAAQGCLGGQPCPSTFVGSAAVGNSVEVVDISNPSAPRIVAGLRNSALPSPWKGSNALYHACSLAVSGNYAFVTAAYSNRLTIIDISNPLNPVIVSSVRDNTNYNFPVDVAVRGNYAYVADQASAGKVAVVDVSDPANPRLVASVTNASLLNGGYRIRLRGNFAYVSASGVATVTAIDISNPLSPVVAGHLTDSAHLFKTTGLDVDTAGRYVVASSPYLSSQPQSVYPPFPAATGTVSALQIDPAAIGVTISAGSKPANPTTQTSANFSFATTDAIASVLCGLDQSPLASCTSPTTQQYASLAPGPHTFTVQATDAAGNTATDSYAWTISGAGQAPVNTAAPTISGSAVVGQLLTASNGSWTGTPAPTFSYQWSDCDANGANCVPATGTGAMSSTYTVSPSDAGFTLEVTVTGTNTTGSVPAASSPTAGVRAAPVNTAAPTISGSAVVGQLLTASNGSWTGTPAPTFSYQWSDCDANGTSCVPATGAGAMSSTYTVQSGDTGSTLEVTVTGTNTAGSAAAASGPTTVVGSGGTGGSAPVNTAAPTISGSAVEAQTLTASNGSWTGSPAPTFSYQWQRCDAAGNSCGPISGAMSSTYSVLAADVGRTLSVVVTASNPSGSPQASSGASPVVTSAPGPVTPLIDDFNRSDNTGPPSASWSHAGIASSTATSDLLVKGQQLTSTTNANGADYWNPLAFGPDSEAWVTVVTKPIVDQDSVSLGLRVQNPGSTTGGGYQAYYVFRSKPPEQYKILLRTNGQAGSTTLTSVNGPTLNPGDKLLFRAIGSTLELWRESGTTWTRILHTTNSAIPGAGYLMLSARNPTVRLDDFGGGTLP